MGVAEQDQVEPPPPRKLRLKFLEGVRHQNLAPRHLLDAGALPERSAGGFLEAAAVVVVVAEHRQERDAGLPVPGEDGRRADVPQVEDDPHAFRAEPFESRSDRRRVVVGVG